MGSPTGTSSNEAVATGGGGNDWPGLALADMATLSGITRGKSFYENWARPTIPNATTGDLLWMFTSDGDGTVTDMGPDGLRISRGNAAGGSNVSTYLSMRKLIIPASGPFAVACEARFTDLGSSGLQFVGTGDWYFGINKPTASNTKFIYLHGATEIAWSAGPNIDNSFHRIVMAYDGTTLTITFDGTPVFAGPPDVAPSAVRSPILYISKSSAAATFRQVAILIP